MQLHWPWSAAVEPPADAQAGRCTSYVCHLGNSWLKKKTQGRGPSHFESSGLPLTVRAVDGANCCHSDIQCSLALTSWRLDSRTLPWLTHSTPQATGTPNLMRLTKRTAGVSSNDTAGAVFPRQLQSGYLLPHVPHMQVPQNLLPLSGSSPAWKRHQKEKIVKDI